jgi:hypothetical protein
MALSPEVNKNEPKDRFIDDLWRDFHTNYDNVGKAGMFIGYPHEEFRIQGIPNPWQTIAWRKVIAKITEDGFCKLPFYLNYQEDEEVLFEKLFTERFSSHPNPEKLKVTIICGYFWKLNDKRRDKMLNLVVDSMLKKGTSVKIWTQDETLAECFGERIGISPTWDKLEFNLVKERIDVHYTLIEDESAKDNSLFILELPHTEAHPFRLETFLTFNKLRELNCDPDELRSILHSYTKFGLFKRILFRCNLARNTERNKN